MAWMIYVISLLALAQVDNMSNKCMVLLNLMALDQDLISLKP
jgi:hypothetical protein